MASDENAAKPIIIESAPREKTVVAAAAPAESAEEPHATIVFLRHGQSVWNEASLFTGWADVELTTLGKNEAAAGATSMWREGITVDVAYTSLLKRAQQTLEIVRRRPSLLPAYSNTYYFLGYSYVIEIVHVA